LIKANIKSAQITAVITQTTFFLNNTFKFQDRSGSVSVGEFLSVPELKENPLVKRVVDVFDDDMSGEVDFKGNLKIFCLLHVMGKI
jgi:hypothetical protein